MLKGSIFTLLAAMVATTVMAAPAAAPAAAVATPVHLEKRITCQFGNIFGAGDAACSASCIIQGQGFHGGYCDDHKVCRCTY
ncbi:MAG: atesin-3 [Linnemannia gamsii]|nr:MAG: atesin-3 [Linnemannia gamsii]